MKKFFKRYVAVISLLTLGGEMIAKLPEKDPVGVLQAIEDEHVHAQQDREANIEILRQQVVQNNNELANIQQHPDQPMQPLQQAQVRVPVPQPLQAEAQAPVQRQQGVPRAHAVPQSRYSEDDKTMIATMGITFAYWGMHRYLLPEKISAYMPHTDYLFAWGFTCIAGCLAHKAYTAKCNNIGHKIGKGIAYAGAALSALYALNLIVRSKN